MWLPLLQANESIISALLRKCIVACKVVNTGRVYYRVLQNKPAENKTIFWDQAIELDNSICPYFNHPKGTFDILQSIWL